MRNSLQNTYIFLASNDRASLYKKAGSGLTHPQTVDYVHPEAHVKERDHDKPGHVSESATYGGHAYEPKTSYTAKHLHFFVRQMVDVLESLHSHNTFDQLIIIAPKHLAQNQRNRDCPHDNSNQPIKNFLCLILTKILYYLPQRLENKRMSKGTHMQKGPASFNRVIIFGRPGSGKSTFALQLAETLQLPLYHLDKYFFTKGWVEQDYDVFIRLQKELVNQSQWIIDGNSHKSLDIRFSRADLVIFFNFSRGRCLWRIFKRLLDKNPHIDDRAAGCSETVRWSLIKYLWTYEKRVRVLAQELKDRYPNLTVLEVRKPKDLYALEKRLTHLVNNKKPMVQSTINLL